MITQRLKKDGQSLLEYGLVITCVVAALIAMQFYVKRAMQGRLRSAADQIGEQYEPGKMSGEITTRVDRNITTEIKTDVPLDLEGRDGEKVDGYATRRTETIHKDEVTREGTETMGEFGSSLWE